MIKTASIKNKLALKYNLKKISEEELNNIVDINISTVDNNDINQYVDFNDLDYFPNLRRLKIQYCFIDREVLEKIIKLEKLEYISFIFCEFDDNIQDLMRELKVRNFTIKKAINFRLEYLNNKIYEKLIICDETIFNQLIIDCDLLDISECNLVDKLILLNLNVKKIVISYDEYENNKDIYENLDYKVDVKTKDGLSIDKRINNYE